MTGRFETRADRLARLTSGPFDLLVAGGGIVGAGIARDAAMRGLEAVSYTHLRAHETVLDLVCRLLLEKKKQTIKTCKEQTLDR